MWSVAVTKSSDQYSRFRILKNGICITHSDFLDLLKSSGRFREFYNHLLATCRFRGFFWENRPVSSSNLNQTYECAVINSRFLAGCKPDSHSFKQYFRNDKQVVTFQNLGNDACLIVPCPHVPHSAYSHIGPFTRHAPEAQIHDFWRTVALEMESRITDEPRWLSTSGLGVTWLHARIDSRPKYYQTEEYKVFPQ